MFDNIAPAYDFMNRAMTFGIDRRWRDRAVRCIAALKPRRVLDVATGTADMAIRIARAIPGAKVTGVDLSEQMLRIGRRKVEEAGLAARVALEKGDGLSLPFPDDSFDAITVAYGVRNFEHIAQGYAEMARVLRPGGMLCVLELSVPSNPVVRLGYKAYTRLLIPAVGRLVSSDSRAYSYLPESVAAMPSGERMLALMREAGLGNARLTSLTLGVCSIYTAMKPG